jgi:hypothetical protein
MSQSEQHRAWFLFSRFSKFGGQSVTSPTNEMLASCASKERIALRSVMLPAKLDSQSLVFS